MVEYPTGQNGHIKRLSAFYDILHDTIKLQDIIIQNKSLNSPDNDHKSIDKPFFRLRIADFVLRKDTIIEVSKTIEVIIANSSSTLANFKILYRFEFNKNLEYVKEYSDIFDIDPFVNEFLEHIIIATTRGILYSELKGTNLDSNKILPLTKPSIVPHL